MIDGFKDQYDWLSNFAPVTILYGGLTFPSTENAYQACKGTSMQHALKCTMCAPNISKRLGKMTAIRDDWMDVRLKIMRDITILKYNDPEYALQLVHTGYQEIIEGNWWHDNFWGDCHCPRCKGFKGENNLGKIIMEVREVIGG